MTSCWVNFTSTPMLQILNKIKNNMIKLWSQSTINDQKSRLHLVACNRNQNSRLHLIACNQNEWSTSHALHIARYFMFHFTSFHIVFYVISCCTSHISLYALHTLYAYHACRALDAFHAHRVFHALHCISRHFIHHFIMKIYFILIHGI